MPKEEVEVDPSMWGGAHMAEYNCYHMVGVVENEFLKVGRDPYTIPWKQRWPWKILSKN